MRPDIVLQPDGYVTSESAQALREFHPEVVLYLPQIPQNTGSIARSCAAFSCNLHLIEPMAFQITERALRRAGLDYWEFVSVTTHTSWLAFLQKHSHRRFVIVETGGTQNPSSFDFKPNDLLVFGAETFGIPADAINAAIASAGKDNVEILTIPMFNRGVRSLNVSNTASIVLFQAVMHLHKLRTE